MLTNIGFLWYRSFDKNGMVFESLKKIPIFFRLAYYVFFSISVYLVLSFLQGYIDFSIYDISETNLLLFQIIGKILFYCILFGSSSIVFYEFLFNKNIALLIEKNNNKVKNTKKYKLQWWRLRNMHIIFRFLCYCVLYYLFLEVAYFQFLSFITDTQGLLVEANTTTANKLVDKFESIVVKWSIAYALIIVFIEWNRKRVLFKMKKISVSAGNSKDIQ